MDLEYFQNLLKHKVPHALTRYGDGEWKIFDNANCNRKGFKFNSKLDQNFRRELIKSYMHKNKNYYVADKEPISACVFVNENHLKFLKIVGLFNLFPVIFIGNEKAKVGNLKFKIDAFYPVLNNAWRYHPNLHEELLKEISSHKMPCLVLFACGPYSNVLIYKIWSKNKNNILWNIGSVFDPHLFGKNTRKYHERLSE